MKFYIDVALPVPLRKSFVYLPKENTKIDNYIIGARVKVPFGPRKLIGIINDILVNDKSEHQYQLKKIIAIIDRESLFTENLMNLMEFAAGYYHHPLGEVLFSGLPGFIKQGEELEKYSYFNTKQVYLNQDANFIKNSGYYKKYSDVQKKLIAILEKNNTGLSYSALNHLGFKTTTIHSLVRNKILFIEDKTKILDKPIANINTILKQKLLELNHEQKIAVDKILEVTQNFNNYKSFLLYGITGSGKTEVYLNLIYQAILANKQVLVLVPEISLTPQTVNRFKSRFNVDIAVIHSKVDMSLKAKDWLAAKTNHAKIIIGTRSAIFTPIKYLGLIIIDEEHDQSFKQQEGFKYNGRDLAISRARLLNIPIVLGSATPSIESVANVMNNKYELLKLSKRAGEAVLPKIKLLNIKHKLLQAGLSKELLDLIRANLNNNKQVLLFLNRRGYAPVLKCLDCSWGAECDRCNVYFTMHKNEGYLACHYCDKKLKLVSNCPECGSVNLNTYGIGTEKIAEFLNQEFSSYGDDICLRIDRDTVKTKKQLENKLDIINLNEPKILLGTQMLAKGHHFPNVSLVAVIDSDNSLFSTDFRAPEHLAQLLIQVAGRAGRVSRDSKSTHQDEVVIQTMQPEHQLLQDILHKNYWEIAQDLYHIRKIANLPPVNNWVLLRAESYQQAKTMDFLSLVRKAAVEILDKKINISSPLLAPRLKKAGLYRGQLLFSCNERKVLIIAVDKILDDVLTNKELNISSMKWSLDVDPMDIY